MKIALLGDSTLDNASYTSGGPSVVEHLEDLLGDSGHATLHAIDGSTTDDVPDQLTEVSADASFLVLSVGGNDAMLEIDILTRPVESVWHALTELDRVVADFDRAYRRCLAEVVALDRPLAVCTIYNGAFDVSTGEDRVVATALRIWNDAIIQAAVDHALPVIDLRRVCNERSDFANPIEPNAVGGLKIARAILDAAHESPSGTSWLIPTDVTPSN